MGAVGPRVIKYGIDADEMGDHPKEWLSLSGEVSKTLHDSKFEKGKFSLLCKGAGEVEGHLKDDVGVEVVEDHSKESFLGLVGFEETCYGVKNAKRKLCFLDEDAGRPVGKKNKLLHFI